MTGLDWLPMQYTPNLVAELVFGNVWRCGPYMIFPTTAPETIDQVWTLEYGTAEVGRYPTVAQAKDAAENHLRKVLS